MNMNSRLSLVLFAAICVSSNEVFSLGIVSTSTSHAAKSKFAMQALPDTDFSHNNDEYKLPIQQYKETAIALQAVLQEASLVASRLEALSNHLKSVESMDPDLAPGMLLSSTSTNTSTSSSRRLDIAVQRALDTSEMTGRLSLATELAWLKVDRLLQQDEATGGERGAKKLLSHPSFRYNYAAAHLNMNMNMNLRERKNDSVTGKLQSYAQRIQQGVQKMQEEVTVDQQRLEQREYRRYIFLNSLMDS
jgi:hypothetical protein